jgi:hypothetical protein
MLRRAIHHDLSTAFVDLCALVRHLRRLQFVGTVRLEMSDYDADIVFTRNGKLHAREHDHSAGTFAEGDQAFRSILTRATREPMGRIHVFDGDPGEPPPGEMFVDDLIRHAAFQSIDAVN